MNCVFCDIIAGKIAAEVVWRTEDAVAFLDHRPVFPGHVLLAPVQHVETLADLPAGHVGPLFRIAQKLERAVENGLDAQGTFIGINNRISQSVPHLHIHLVPRRKGDGLRGFFWPRHKYASDEQMADFGARIRRALDSEAT